MENTGNSHSITEQYGIAALELASSGALLVSREGVILWVNSAFLNLSGYPSDEIIGNTFPLLAWQEQSPDTYRGLWPAILQGQTWRTELENRSKSGRSYMEEQVVIPVKDAADQLNHIIVLAREVLPNQPSEQERERLVSIVENSSDAIIGKTLDGVILSWNSAAQRMYGYTAEEMLGKNIATLVPPERQGELPGIFAQLKRGGQIGQMETERVCKDGKRLYVSLTISPIRDASGKIMGASTIARDITTRKQHERELEAVVTIANALRAAASVYEMLPVILSETASLMGGNGAAMALPDRETGEIVIEQAIGNLSGWMGMRLKPGQGVSGHVIEAGEVFLSDDIANEPLLQYAHLVDEPQAIACVPLKAYHAAIGALWVSRETPIQGSELRLMTAIADMAANAIHRASLHEQTERRLQRLAALHAIDEAISSSLDMSVTLGVLLDQVIWQLGVDAAGVLLLNPHSETLEYAAQRGFHSRSFPRRRLYLEQDIAWKAVKTGSVIQIPDLLENKRYFSRADLIAGEGFVSYCAAPLVAKEQVKGVLEIFSRSPLSTDPEWLDFLEALAKQAAIAIDNALLFSDLQRSNEEIAQAYDTTLEGWVRTLGMRDGETEDHTQRVTDLTMRMAAAVEIPSEQMEYIRRGALLHDIGKMGVPDRILLKAGPLTLQEQAIIRKHPEYAYNLLYPITYLRPALDIPYCHHEKWDGTGYPRGLKGEQIPLSARLFSVVDVWDALTSNRPYRTAWSEEKARSYLKEQAGTHFESRLIDIFFESCLPA